jgi:hypothetical protein
MAAPSRLKVIEDRQILDGLDFDKLLVEKMSEVNFVSRGQLLPWGQLHP